MENANLSHARSLTGFDPNILESSSTKKNIEANGKRYAIDERETSHSGKFSSTGEAFLVLKPTHQKANKTQNRFKPYLRESRLPTNRVVRHDITESEELSGLASRFVLARVSNNEFIVGQCAFNEFLDLQCSSKQRSSQAVVMASKTALQQQLAKQHMVQDSLSSTAHSESEVTDKSIVNEALKYDDSVPIGLAEECTMDCDETNVNDVDVSVFRATPTEKANNELERNLNGSNGFTDKSVCDETSMTPIPLVKKQPNPQEDKIQLTTYATNIIPGATGSHDQHYETDFGGTNVCPSREETRKDVRPVFKEGEVDRIWQSYQKPQLTPVQPNNTLQPPKQDKTKPPAKTVPSTNVDKAYRSLPRRACLVHLKEQYNLDHDLLSQPRATKYLVKVRTEISPGRYMAKLELHCSSKDNRLPNLDATIQKDDAPQDDRETKPTKERKHFPWNIDKIGHVLFSSALEIFSGDFQYPLPNKKAVASRIGYGGNAIVFVVFYSGKEFAVKKTVYRSKEISSHSQLEHPNIINLEAVLIGERHERHKDKRYVYCFMNKMDINFRNVLSTKEHGCLKHMKMQLIEKREQWELVLTNTKHVLRSVLKALDYMHSQGLVHRDIKASNILVKMQCHCSEVLYCTCVERKKFLVQIGDFDSTTTVPGYQLQLEEHQMIRYASVLPLGTMGYRAPEVSMHLILSGPYEVLYTTSVDIWSFGCLLLTVFIGKSGPLKQRGEASLLLSVQDQPYSQDLYHQIIKLKEVQKYYANTPGVCDLVQKCLQVQPHCRPTAKELLELDFFAIPKGGNHG